MRYKWELYADVIRNCPRCTTDLIRVSNCSMAVINTATDLGLIRGKWERGLKDRIRARFKVWYATDKGREFVRLIEEIRSLLENE